MHIVCLLFHASTDFPFFPGVICARQRVPQPRWRASARPTLCPLSSVLCPLSSVFRPPPSLIKNPRVSTSRNCGGTRKHVRLSTPTRVCALRSSARFTETERSRVTPPRGEFRISHFEFRILNFSILLHRRFHLEEPSPATRHDRLPLLITGR